MSHRSSSSQFISSHFVRTSSSAVLAVAAFVAILLGAAQPAQALTIELPTPSGSGQYGRMVATLPNGNIVVVGAYNGGTTTDTGAV